MATKAVKEESKDLLQQMEEKYGMGSIVRADTIEEVHEYISTGSLTLDLAIGHGKGIPKEGKITHIVGQPSAGKTTLLSHIFAREQQDNGGDCALLDVEGTYMLDYAVQLGVDLSKLYIIDVKALLKKKKKDEIQAISGEEWLEILCDLLSTKRFGAIGLDSIAELCPMAELQAGLLQGSIAGIGRLMSKSLRAITARALPTNTAVILLNQYRMSPGKYGNPLIEAAGEAMKYYTCLKLELAPKMVKEDSDVIGIDVTAKVAKSKIGIPQRSGEYHILYGHGIQKINEIVDLAEELKLFEKSGSWYNWKDTRLANGRDAIIALLKDNIELAEEIEQSVMDKLKPVVIESELVKEV